MRYENRQPPEGINNVKQGWARDFTLLVVGFFASLALLCWLLLQVIAWSATWIPFSWEQTLTQAWQIPEEPDPRQIYLQTLAESLAHAGGLSPDIKIKVHYVAEENPEEKTINALATLGGNMIIFEGLLDTLNSEQGLAFVIAHELAHLQHRHPVRALARGLSLSLITAMVFGRTDLAQLAGLSGNLVLLDYSREQEDQADSWALDALNKYYGHVSGANELFRKLLEQKAENNVATPEWLSTHPDLEVRIHQLKQQAENRGYFDDVKLTPIAQF